MSTHRAIDRVCILAVVLCILISLVMMGGEDLGLMKRSNTMGYESRLFDTSRVHTLDIKIDDWETFLSTCQSEQYSTCTVTIDGESYANVAIRGKGNTSLSSVSSMGSQRYSFKIEFDHYDNALNYHGLDKLSLNNAIQDTTYMKDYLTYQMMGQFGVDSPLCSYVYITVNGEDWGLYLAVEGVEDSFLRRNYGSSYGELYKPDSMSMGARDDGEEGTQGPDMGGFDPGAMGEDFQMPEGFDPFGMGGMPEDFDPGAAEGTETSEDPAAMGEDFQMPEGFDPAAMGGEMQMPEGFDPTAMESFDPSAVEGGESAESSGEAAPPEDFSGFPGGFDPGAMGGENGAAEGGENEDTGEFPGFPGGGGFDFGGLGGFGMGSSDVKLQYIDDDPASYSNIFNNAKTDINDQDKTRLIEALKALSSGEDLESTLDVEEVMRYFVVHNFVCNDDSYTGTMIHNYYLYEEEGQLSMIPWDYNLGFGTFSAGAATSTVNKPIDTPVSGGTSDRPMVDWIFSNEEYTRLYHEYFAQFLETVDIAGIIEEAYTLIAPYVEKDPTRFCTYEEFETGVETLKSFCQLRTESVLGQLDGTIPSTQDGQSADSSALVDASDLTLGAMGSMASTGGGAPGGGENGGGGGFPGMDMGGFPGFGEVPAETEDTDTPSSAQGTSAQEGFDPAAMGGDMQMPEGFEPGAMSGDMQMPEGFDPGAMGGDMQMSEGFDPGAMGGDMQLPEGFDPGAMGGDMQMSEGFDPGAMGGDMQMPEGFDPAAMGSDTAEVADVSDSALESEEPAGTADPTGEMAPPEGMEMPQNMDFGNMDFSGMGGPGGQSPENQKEMLILLGASLGLLAVGLLIAKLYRRS